MEQIAAHLRGVAATLRLPSVRQIALEPATREVFRVTVQYGSGRFASTVTTVQRRVDGFEAQTVYVGLFHNHPMTRTLAAQDYETFSATVRALGFDRLPDDVTALNINADLWFIERAAAGFGKSLLMNASTPQPPYAQVITCFTLLVPEVARQIPPT